MRRVRYAALTDTSMVRMTLSLAPRKGAVTFMHLLGLLRTAEAEFFAASVRR